MGRTSDARQRLMNAAYDLVWEFSYWAVTIDAICERASVKKGSFYYFFASKSELAVAAIRAWWEARQAVLEDFFRQEIAPLERIRGYLDYLMGRQLKSYQETGQVLGCPIYALGAQISTQDQELRALILEIIHRHGSYFEEAIQEAQLLGQMEPGDAAQKARTLLFCYAGLLSQARIENNVELVRQLSPTVLATIGVGSPERTKADALSQATSA